MIRPRSGQLKLDRVLLLLFFALFLLASPALLWWASTENPWYVPYLVWLLLIALAAGMYGRGSPHDL